MTKRVKKAIGMQDVWKPWGGADAERYYGMEFTTDEKWAVYDAIEEKTGLNYVRDHLMHQSMYAFGEAHGVPHCHTFGDDALVFCCIQLEIDPRQFPHNTPKLPIDGFADAAARKFSDFSPAKNEIQGDVQHSKLYDFWIKWFDSMHAQLGCQRSGHGSCRDAYIKPDLRVLALTIARSNKKGAQKERLSAKPKLRLVHSVD
jgi:hypothetical protein